MTAASSLVSKPETSSTFAIPILFVLAVLRAEAPPNSLTVTSSSEGEGRAPAERIAVKSVKSVKSFIAGGRVECGSERELRGG